MKPLIQKNSTLTDRVSEQNNQDEYARQVAPLPAVVAWLDNNVGLELCRILSDRGIPVIALVTDSNNYRCKTRYVQRIIEVANGDKGLIKALNDLKVDLPDGAVLCPTTDATAQIASENCATLRSNYRMAIADQNSLALLGDKSRVGDIAREAGFLVPQTWCVTSLSDMKALVEACTFPLVVKPSVRTDAWWKTVREKALKVDDEAQLTEILSLGVGLVPSVIVQEWIEGTDADNFFYLSYISRNRQKVADLVGRKIRQWPPLTGVGASSEHVDAPQLEEVSQRLLASLDFHGFCEIDFKRRAGTNDFYFIEANVGRPSLQLALAESCGVEMQYIMYCDCAGLPVSLPSKPIYSGAKCVVWRFELKAAMRAILKGELTFGAWISSLKGRRRSVDIHLGDPRVIWQGFVLDSLKGAAEKLKGRFLQRLTVSDLPNNSAL